MTDSNSEHEALLNLLLWAGYNHRRVWAGGTDSFYAIDGDSFYAAETAEELLGQVDGQGRGKA